MHEKKKKNESDELVSEKDYGGGEPDFESWSNERCKSYWNTLKKNHPSWDDKIKAVGKFTDNPAAFLSTIQKRASGKWPREA